MFIKVVICGPNVQENVIYRQNMICGVYLSPSSAFIANKSVG